MSDINSVLHLSARGLQFIMRFEGFAAAPYTDVAGNPSIGYGHKLRPGENYLYPISTAEAEVLLHNDVSDAEKAIHTLVNVTLAQPQYDALVSFVYNVGIEAFTGSTLLSLLNGGNYDGAAGEFSHWDKIHLNGALVNSPGLAARRAAETIMFRESGV